MNRVALGLLTVFLSLGTWGVAFAQPDNVIEAPLSIPDDPYGTLGWRWPTTGYTITGDYGESRFDGPHKGIDIGVKLAPVYSVARGEVISSGKYTKDPILYVTVKQDDRDPNGNNLITRYLHLDSFSVRKYDRVSRGQQIGISGNTGAPGESEGRGYHLHFDVNNANNPTPSYSQTINPEYFWPNIFNFVITSESDDSHHSDHLHFRYDDPEYFIDQILIDYVGEDKFNEWMYNSAPEDRTLTNLKKHFNITDKKIEKLDKDAKDKATKGKK